jgi:hypothetical protein
LPDRLQRARLLALAYAVEGGLQSALPKLRSD